MLPLLLALLLLSHFVQTYGLPDIRKQKQSNLKPNACGPGSFVSMEQGVLRFTL